MPANTTKRIAIIGAGPAGLTAAELLKQKGYTNVTVFERSERAGGKCYSLDHDGRSYEMGAGIVAENNRVVLQLAKQFGVTTKQADFNASILLDAATGQIIPEQTWLKKLSTIAELLLKYRSLALHHKAVAAPGFAKLDANIHQPFTLWAQHHGVKLLGPEFGLFFTGWGYGYLDEIPAAYVLKYYSWETIKLFAQKKMYKFPDGIQKLWMAVAKHHNVRYNTTIQKIIRANTIMLQTTTGEFEFDDIIITTPLDESLQYLDAAETEKELFSKIIYCDYRTYAVFLNNFPNSSGYVPGNYTAARAGHPVFWYQRYEDSNLYTFYVLGDWKIGNEQVLKNIATVVEQLGGTVERLHSSHHWKYFPHVSSADMADGYFDQLESLQGTNHTYYAGEVMNFSTVGLSAQYAEQLVQKYF